MLYRKQKIAVTINPTTAYRIGIPIMTPMLPNPKLVISPAGPGSEKADAEYAEQSKDDADDEVNGCQYE